MNKGIKIFLGALSIVSFLSSIGFALVWLGVSPDSNLFPRLFLWTLLTFGIGLLSYYIGNSNAEEPTEID